MKIVTGVCLCAILTLLSGCQLPIERELLAEEATAYRADPRWSGPSPSVVPYVERTVGEERVAARLTILHGEDGPVYVARVYIPSRPTGDGAVHEVVLRDGEGIEWAPIGHEVGEESGHMHGDPHAPSFASKTFVLFFPAPRPMPLELIIRLHDSEVSFVTDHQFR